MGWAPQGVSQVTNPPIGTGWGALRRWVQGEQLIPTSLVSPGSPAACWREAFWESSSSSSTPGHGAWGACGAARGARIPAAPRRRRAPSHPPLPPDPPSPPLQPSLCGARKKMENVSKVGPGIVGLQGEGSGCEKRDATGGHIHPWCYTRRFLVTSDRVGLSSSWCWLRGGRRGKQGGSSWWGDVGHLQDEESLEKRK